ncbi:MAG: hypothetical protein NT125_08305 [Candidatus Bipolaricaulota bacterium]|nr:hypothetical protein [Candidatus Bipolaricaulota bacterium]
MINSVSDVIRCEEWLKGDLLTSVRQGPTLLLASDYGGEHKGAQFETLSFLLVDLQYQWLWEELRTKLRKRSLLQRRRMAFKSLGDAARRRAVVPFLRYANTLPGLLATFALDRGAIDMLAELPPGSDDSGVGALSGWRLSPFRKLSCVAQLGATLVAGMSAPGQNLIWISDDDDIAPNRQKLFEATRTIGHYTSMILPHEMGHLRFGTAGTVDPGNLQVEDLVALADLAAGAVSEMLTLSWRNVGTGASKILLPGSRSLTDKAKLIGNWLAENEHPLRKLVILVEGEGRMYKTKVVSIFSEDALPCESPFDWRRDVDEHLKEE